MLAWLGLRKGLAQAITVLRQHFVKEDWMLLLSLSVYAGGVVFLCASFTAASDHLPPLLQFKTDLLNLGIVTGLWVISTGLGWCAVRRAKYAVDDRRLRKCRKVFVGHSLFSAFAIAVLIIGGFVYFKFNRGERVRAEDEAVSVRAKFGEGVAYDREVAKYITLNFKGQLGEVTQKYQLAGTLLTNPPILDMAGVNSVAELKIRGELLTDYIIAARTLRDFCKSSIAIHRYEVDRHVLSSQTRQKILNDFERHTEELNPTIVAMRDAELRKCEMVLKVVQHLEKNWGRWTWDSAEGTLAFDNDSHAKSYQLLAAKVAEEQAKIVELQKRLVSLQRNTE
jgi:hypothetical protein